MIDAALVYTAYTALHRYCLEVGSVGPLAVPYRVAGLGHAQTREAADIIASDIRLLWEHHPIRCSELYYCFLYLWAQILRVSHRQHPTMHRAGEWRNLAWFSLRVLKGRESDNREASRGAFKRWYYEWIQKEYPHPDQDALRASFPWVEPYGTDEERLAHHHLQTLRHLSHEGLEVADILRNYAPTGRPRNPARTEPWHIWLVLAFPDSWEHQLPWTMETDVLTLLTLPDVWAPWYAFFYINVPVARQDYVLRSLENFVIQARTTKKLSMYHYKRMRRLLAKWRHDERMSES